MESLILLESDKLGDLDIIDKISYYNLKPNSKSKVVDLKDNKKLIIAAQEGVLKLIKIFNEDAQPFYAAPDIKNYIINDYQHLARILR